MVEDSLWQIAGLPFYGLRENGDVLRILSLTLQFMS